ncbi:hypothetical protein F5B21DRAFT_87891 [Xylaria acuta]|nr:hypothetical protein F5B21DRAFT_87891 [Xylaria acuta]
MLWTCASVMTSFIFLVIPLVPLSASPLRSFPWCCLATPFIQAQGVTNAAQNKPSNVSQHAQHSQAKCSTNYIRQMRNDKIEEVLGVSTSFKLVLEHKPFPFRRRTAPLLCRCLYWDQTFMPPLGAIDEYCNLKIPPSP